VVNYLRACPLPEAAAAVKELESIDPEAVRRAATLAGLAGIVAAAPATTADDDGGQASPTEVAASPADAALAARVGAVLADEEATDDVPGRPAAKPAARTARPAWLWAAWAAAVLLVAVVARAALKPGSERAGR
jgi:hypothetical protein